MEGPPAKKVEKKKISHLEISLCDPDPEFLTKLREAHPESGVPITLLFIISTRRSEIAKQVGLISEQASQQPENAAAQKILEKPMQKLQEITKQLRKHYSEWCWLQFENVYKDLGIEGSDSVNEDSSSLSITIKGLSSKDRITFCQRMWGLECINRIATDDLFVLLEADQLEEELRNIPDWEPDENKTSITHTFACSDANDANAFAEEATRMTKLWRQEPHIEKNEHSVTITVTTPSMKGLTPENIQYASSLSTIYDRRYSC